MTDTTRSNLGVLPSAGAAVQTRRRALRSWARLAFAVPALTMALPAATARASDDDDDHHKHHGYGRFAAALCRVGDVSPQDFAANGVGSDPLRHGHISILGRHHGHYDGFFGWDGSSHEDDDHVARAMIQLRGAAPSAIYEVLFVRAGDGGRETLGPIRTNSDGNFRGLSALPIESGPRVGNFVLTRGGQDQFVSCLDIHEHDHEHDDDQHEGYEGFDWMRRR